MNEINLLECKPEEQDLIIDFYMFLCNPAADQFRTMLY